MPILEQDIVFLRSQVMADVPEGGGAASGAIVVDNQSNNVFDDIPELSRIVGEVSLRQVYLAVQTADTDVYRGARVIIGKPPGDPRVSALIFRTDAFDRRVDMQASIESYLARGPRWNGYLYETHIQGQRVIVLLQREGTELPSVGKTLVLVGNEGLGTEYEQYVRITSVATATRDFTISDGSGIRSFRRQVVTCGISDALRYDFYGAEATDLDAGAPFEGKARVRDTLTADATRYYGAAPLAAAGSVGDISVKASDVYASLVPYAQSETPIVDAKPNQAIDGARAAAGDGAITFDTAAAFDSTHSLYVGGGILPGSLNITGAAVLFDRAGLVVDAGNAQVGTVDYVNGVISLVAPASYPGTKTVTYKLGVDPGTASQSLGIPVTAGNRSSSWAFVLQPIPAAASLRVAYMAGGRWYVLADAGDGALRGADSSYGAGQLNRATGSVIVTCGALPDVDTKIIVTWAPSSTVAGSAPGAARAYFEVDLARPVSPGTLTVSWNDGAAVGSVTDNAGTLAGDGVGGIDYESGRFRLSPDVLPGPGATFTVALSDAGAGHNTALALTDSGSTLTGALQAGVAPGSLALTVTVSHTFGGELFAPPATGTYTVVDEAGALKVVMGDGTRSAAVGAINYATGAISLNKSIPGFVARAFRHFIKVVVAAGGEVTEGYSDEGTYSETCTATLTAAGAAAVARYTTGSGPAASAIFPVGLLRIPDKTRATWREVSYMFADYVANNFIARLAGGQLLVNRSRSTGLYLNPLVAAADWGAPIGVISGALAMLAEWPAGIDSTVNILSASGTYGGLSVDRAVYRFPVAPLRPASVTVSAETIAGVQINGTADASGVISTADMVGKVDFATGIVEVVFKTTEGNAQSPWSLDVTSLGVAGVSTAKVGQVKADSIRLAGVAYTYLPISADIIGLDPVRLPSDGRVPIFRPGDIAVIHHTDTTAPANVINGQTINTGRTRLARARLIGNDGSVIAAGYTANLDAGTVYLTNVTGMPQPVHVEHTIKDEVIVTEALLSGDIILQRPLTHDFPAGSYVSSALVVGNLFARVSAVFDQQSWTNTWSDAPIGATLSANFNTISHPITVTNQAAVTERWAIVFQNTTVFRLIGEHLGVIAEGNIAADFTPINPAEGLPYFTLPAAGWGGGWAAGNVLRINTVGAQFPLGLARATQRGDATLNDDRFTLLVLGDRDQA